MDLNITKISCQRCWCIDCYIKLCFMLICSGPVKMACPVILGKNWYFSCRMRRFVPFKIKLLSEIDDLWLKHFFIMCCFYTICYFDRTEDTIMRYYILLVTIFRGGYLDKYGRESGQVFYRLLAPGTSVHHSKPIYWYWRIF